MSLGADDIDDSDPRRADNGGGIERRADDPHARDGRDTTCGIRPVPKVGDLPRLGEGSVVYRDVDDQLVAAL